MTTYDIAIIGAGAFGSWTASWLRRAGRSVLLLDAWGPGHSRSSSGGESRIIRMGYGADEIYTRMAMRSLAQWQELCRSTGQTLFHRTGVLWIARAGDPYSEASRVTLENAGVGVEILSAEELAQRYPQMVLTDARTFGIFEPESGVLMARRAIAALVEDLMRRGVEYISADIQPPSGRGALDSVRTGEWRADSRRHIRIRMRRVATQIVPRLARQADLPDAARGVVLRSPGGRSAVFSAHTCRFGSTLPIRAVRMDSRIWKAAVSNSPSIATAFHSIRIQAIARRAPEAYLRRIRSSRSGSPRCGMRACRNSASASMRTLRMEIF